MRYPAPLGICALAIVLGFVAGCKPPPEMIRVQEVVKGPPDLTKGAAPAATDQAFQLHTFHLNHIWAGPNGLADASGHYRAKISVWDYDDDTPIAELYFRDDASLSGMEPANPATAKRPYQIDFPGSALMPILSTLRNTNEPVFLYYYHGNWAVGTYNPESIGSD